MSVRVRVSVSGCLLALMGLALPARALPRGPERRGPATHLRRPARGTAPSPLHHRRHHRHHRRPARVIAPTTVTPAGGSPPPSATPAAVSLIIPVEGVTRDRLVDTFDASRSEGRVHEAIDILAPRETPVIAAAAGKVIKLQDSERGGHTIFQLSDDGQTVLYYAHLDHYAAGIADGSVLAQGDLIGYVGDTGNPAPGNYHLHFGVWRVTSLARFWEGTNLNPYPLLRR